jgi:hypothetical protein
MAQMDLLWLGIGAIGIYYIWGNGMGGIFNTSFASGELTGNPNPNYAPITSPQGGQGLLFGRTGDIYQGMGNPIQTISGTWHL